jgi:hypothetical protein
MDETFGSDGLQALGDVVRVSGKPGDHYISDYLNGVPTGTGNITKVMWTGTEWPSRPPNAVFVQWVGPTEPTEGMIEGDEFVGTP